MKRIIALLLTLCLALSLAACRRDEQPPTVPNPPPVDEPEPEQPARDDVVIALSADVDTLDPSVSAGGPEVALFDQMFDTLLAPGGAGGLEGRVAQDWAGSEDGLSYTVTLRPGLTFHNGDPVTADDVVFSVQLYQNSPYQADLTEALSDCQAVGQDQVVFTLDRPYTPFLANLSQMYILPKAYYTASGSGDFSEQPVGSGPYAFAGRTTGQSIELTAVEGYYRGPAALKKAKFLVLSNPGNRLSAIKAGEVDLVETPLADAASLEPIAGIELVDNPTTALCLVAMNREEPPFDNQQVRKAVALAINRESMLDIAAYGHGQVTSLLVNPLAYGAVSDLDAYEYDKQAAQDMLAGSGLETPRDVGELITTEACANQATVLQENLDAVGLECDVVVLEPGAFQSRLSSGNYRMALYAPRLTTDPLYYARLLISDAIGSTNAARFSDPQVDQWFADAESAQGEEQDELLHRVFSRVQQDVPYAAAYVPYRCFGVRKPLIITIRPDGRYELFGASWGNS